MMVGVAVGEWAFDDWIFFFKLQLIEELDHSKLGHSHWSVCFFNCSSLRNLTIPNSMYQIGENAFLGCIVLSMNHTQESNYYRWDFGVKSTMISIWPSVAALQTELFGRKKDDNMQMWYVPALAEGVEYDSTSIPLQGRIPGQALFDFKRIFICGDTEGR